MTSRQRSTHTWLGHLAVCLAALLIGGPILSSAAENDLTDESIRDAVEDAVFFDQAVPFDNVNVTVTEGVVTLTGKVNNLLAKTRAARLAETIKGVRSIVNRIEVKPTVDRTSAQLKKDVEEALLADPATDSYEISTATDSRGQVTLSGTVESWQEKQLAEKVAMSVKGVTGIDNNLTVDYETERPDREITPEVREALRWDALVDHALIDVEVKDGEVMLTGTVGSLAEMRQARHGAWVAGVTEVDASGLKLRDWAKDPKQRKTEYVNKSASKIRQAVEDANLYDPRVKSFNVDTNVTGSVVTLRGVVDNLKAKRAAAENARNTVGVSRVRNRLRVQPTIERSDETVEDAVRNALLRDPYVDRYELTVDVIDGTAYLSGVVDSYFEKAEAEDAAARVNGVVDVSNALVVTDTKWPIVYDPYIYDWYVYDYGWYDYEPTYTAMTDEEIEEDIRDELWWSPFVDSDDINVEVENGVAKLAGHVESWSERRSATENALEGGAISVDNDLTVIEE